MQVFGTSGRIEVEIPFNAPPDRPCRIFVDDGRQFAGARRGDDRVPRRRSVHRFRSDRFARRRARIGAVPVSLEDAIANMAVIDAVFRSAETRRWESPSAF